MTEVNLRAARPPAPVQSAFEDAIKAREDQVRLVNEAQAYANDRLPRARGAAARLVEEARGYSEQAVARSEGDASRFTALLTEYKQAPEVTKERLYLDVMSEVFGRTTKVIIDVDSNAPLMVLPLDQLRGGMAGGDARADRGTSSGGSASSTAPSTGVTLQDANRASRDRSR